MVFICVEMASIMPWKLSSARRSGSFIYRVFRRERIHFYSTGLQAGVCSICNWGTTCIRVCLHGLQETIVRKQANFSKAYKRVQKKKTYYTISCFIYSRFFLTYNILFQIFHGARNYGKYNNVYNLVDNSTATASRYSNS